MEIDITKIKMFDKEAILEKRHQDRKLQTEKILKELQDDNVEGK